MAPHGSRAFASHSHRHRTHLFVCVAGLVTLLGLDGAAAAPQSSRDILRPLPAGSVKLRGFLGRKLDLALANRVMSQDLERLVKPFRSREEKDFGGFACEYWGKWFTSAALGYAYAPSPEYRRVLDQAVQKLLVTQAADGYIGSYAPEVQLGGWDTWCRKYVLHGLIAYYDLFGDDKVLQAASRVASQLTTLLDSKRVNLAETGYPHWKGLPSTSILEPVAMLYQRTGDRSQLDLAQRIVKSWSKGNQLAPSGLRLVEDALAGVPPAGIAAPKAYEMISNYEGLCEMYRATGTRTYLRAAVKLAEGIREHERMIVGSGSNGELWGEGRRNQTELLEKPLETCVTVTWMKLAYQLLRLTGDPVWADELELSLYNALLGAMTPQGDWWSYYCPLAGERVPSHTQHTDAGLSCCVTSGPRGLFLAPRWAVMSSTQGPVINLYGAGTAEVKLEDGTSVNLDQDTEYPRGGIVTIRIKPQRRTRFTLSLRIPQWSRATTVKVNGTAIKVAPGRYARITRVWTRDDEVVVDFDMKGRVTPAPSGAPQVAIMRGPIVLALDNRFAPPAKVAVRLDSRDGTVDLKPVQGTMQDVWMAFDVPFEVHESHDSHKPMPLRMIDFSSAGNGWSPENIFRVWLPQPLFLNEAYPADTWRIMYPTFKGRPRIPSTIR